MPQESPDHPPNSPISDALYPRLLGPAWPLVDPVIQRMHCHGQPIRAVGIFRVRHGTSLWAKLLLPFLRIPAPTPTSQVELIVTPEEKSEKWVRRFDGKPLASLERELPGGLLAEKFGALEFQFRLTFADHAIHYEQIRVTLTLPLLPEIPLPVWASPHASASEAASEDGMGTYVSLEVSAPLAGLVFAYDGTMRREGD